MRALPPPSPRDATAALGVVVLVIVPYVPPWYGTQAIMRTIQDALGGSYRVLLTAVERPMKSRARIIREALSGFGVPMFDTQSPTEYRFSNPKRRRDFEHADRGATDHLNVRDEVPTLLGGAR